MYKKICALIIITIITLGLSFFTFDSSTSHHFSFLSLLNYHFSIANAYAEVPKNNAFTYNTSRVGGRNSGNTSRTSSQNQSSSRSNNQGSYSASYSSHHQRVSNASGSSKDSSTDKGSILKPEAGRPAHNAVAAVGRLFTGERLTPKERATLQKERAKLREERQERREERRENGLFGRRRDDEDKKGKKRGLFGLRGSSSDATKKQGSKKARWMSSEVEIEGVGKFTHKGGSYTTTKNKEDIAVPAGDNKVTVTHRYKGRPSEATIRKNAPKDEKTGKPLPATATKVKTREGKTRYDVRYETYLSNKAGDWVQNNVRQAPKDTVKVQTKPAVQKAKSNTKKTSSPKISSLPIKQVIAGAVRVSPARSTRPSADPINRQIMGYRPSPRAVQWTIGPRATNIIRSQTANE